MRERDASAGEYRGVEGTRPYAGAAEYYARYRPRATAALLEELRHALGWMKASRVLDLGTGPGHLALPVAPLVGEVVGVDPEPDMLSVARRIAAESGIANVRFVLGSSEDLPSLGLGEFQTVTMSASFHWMLDKDQVLANLAAMTDRHKGAVAFVTTGELVGSSAEFAAADELVRSLLDEHMAGAAEGPHPRGRHDPFEDLLGRSAFANVRDVELTYETDIELSTEALLGAHYSISHVLRRLGARRAELEAKTRQALAALGAPPVARVTYRESALLGLRP